MIVVSKNDKNGLLRSKRINTVDISKLSVVKTSQYRYKLMYDNYIVKDNLSLYDILNKINELKEEYSNDRYWE